MIDAPWFFIAMPSRSGASPGDELRPRKDG
jgi:hypothetical protein